MQIKKYFAVMRSFLQITLPLLIVGGAFVAIYTYDPAFFNSITEKVNDHPLGCGLIRWGLLLFFILLWPYFALKAGHHLKATQEQIQHWQKEVWRIGIWLIIFELSICENLLNKIIHLLGG